MRSTRRPRATQLWVASISAATLTITACGGSESGQSSVDAGQSDANRPDDPTLSGSTPSKVLVPQSTSPRPGTPSLPWSNEPDSASAALGNTSVCWSTPPMNGTDEISFVNATEDYGLVEPLTGMYGHAIAAGDPNGDGWTDLFVGTFADRPVEDYQVRGAEGPSPDKLLLGGPDGFRVDESFPGQLARSSGATFADLDRDGDLDLIVSRNPRGDSEVGSRPTTIFERDRDGWSISTELAHDVGGRSIAAVDFDRDGLPDLAIAGDRFGAGPTRFYRNLGEMKFEDTTATWGIPSDVETLALSTIDLDGDGWLDVVFSGDPRVLMGRGPGEFEIVDAPALEWEIYGEEDDPAGIAVGDLDNDGRPDLVVGQHFNSTLEFGERVPVRIFLNRSEPGELELIDVTDEAGSLPLPTKSPHVTIVDLDNDGNQDIATSAASPEATPVVLRNVGFDDGIPVFEASSEVSDRYWVTGVTADFDGDGRVDVVNVAWEPTSPTVASRSTGPSGASLELDVSAIDGLEVGAAISVGAPGSSSPIGRAWVASTSGYAAGPGRVIHLGLGGFRGDIDVTVEHVDGTTTTFSAEEGSVRACP